jgi:hypothetical protein
MARTSLFVALAVASSSASSSSSSSSCTSPASCSFNGDCSPSAPSTCLCDPGWTGPTCGSLNIGRYDPALGHPWTAGSSSWGGYPVQDPSDGSWHLFYSGFSRGCGLYGWGTNSRIVHAVSSSPLGPFTDVDIVEPEFSHNAHAMRIDGAGPEGGPLYLVWYIGCGQGEKITNCTDTPTPADSLPLAPRTVPPRGPGSNPSPLCSPTPGIHAELGEFYSTFSSAPSPNGPWTPLGRPAIVGSGNASLWDGFITNPSPAKGPNGTVLLAFRSSSTTHGESMAVATAPSWNGTFTYPPEMAISRGEDPFVFVNQRGARIMLWHDDDATDAGGLAFAPPESPDTWTVVNRLMYDSTLTWVNGSTVTVADRERPKLLVDDFGVPLALINGLMPLPANESGSASFTAFAPIVLE